MFFGKGCRDASKAELLGVIGINSEALSERYLGMQTNAGQSKIGTFRYLRDRVWEKVKGWMEKLLSTAGKEVLIKAVAQALTVYSMACFRLPRGLCDNIMKIIRQFWWGSKAGRRKPNWVAWDVMTRPKHLGGLGFHDMEIFNLALLARQAWRVLTKPDSLSAIILKDAYFPETTLLEAQLGGRPSQIWRAVLDGRDMLKLGIIRRIGNGQTTRIWSHNWLPRHGMMRPITSRIPMPPTTVSELITVATAT